jgi:DNA-binding transcriptional MerR regulator
MGSKFRCIRSTSTETQSISENDFELLDKMPLTLFLLIPESTPDCILGMEQTKMVKIGQVSRETGLSIDTIRFYEKQGLSKRPSRTEGGFRVFGPEEIQGLKFVRKAQELGFSLEQIRELLILKADHVPACSHVRDMLEQKLVGVEQKIHELRSLKHSLNNALHQCKRGLKNVSRGHKDRCPVLEEISKAARR